MSVNETTDLKNAIPYINIQRLMERAYSVQKKTGFADRGSRIAALARAIGKPPGNMYKYVGDTPTRPITRALQKKIEAAFGLPSRYLEILHSPMDLQKLLQSMPQATGLQSTYFVATSTAQERLARSVLAMVESGHENDIEALANMAESMLQMRQAG